MACRSETLKILKEIGKNIECLCEQRATITHQIERLQMLMDLTAMEDPDYAAYVERVGRERAMDIAIFWMASDEYGRLLTVDPGGRMAHAEAEERKRELEKELGLTEAKAPVGECKQPF